jgi:6-phosphofructokinase 2
VTRECLTVNEDETGPQYRFAFPGPTITVREQDSCLALLAEVGADADLIVASGSLPPGVPADFYQRVADVVDDLDARLIVDTSGPALKQLRRGAFLVRPSIRELREWVRLELRTTDDQLAATRDLIDRGICEVVALSLGAEGALLVTEERAERIPSVEVRVLSGVGAGDSMVAGIACGLRHGWPLRDAVRYGVAAGAAMLQTPGTALCRRADVEHLYARLTRSHDGRRGVRASGPAAGTAVR